VIGVPFRGCPGGFRGCQGVLALTHFVVSGCGLPQHERRAKAVNISRLIKICLADVSDAV
jgi:hypothetical protein